MPQFTLKRSGVVIAWLCVWLSLLRVATPEWRVMLGVGMIVFLISWASLVTTRNQSPMLRRGVLGLVSLNCVWLLWRGLYPGMYYLFGLSMILLLWVGVLTGCWLLAVSSLATREPAPKPRGVRRQEFAIAVIPLITTVLLAFQIPLRLAAAPALPALAAQLEAKTPPGGEVQCGIYRIRVPGKQRVNRDPVYFQLDNDSESAFVYSPNGLEDIRYNAGSRGQLFGDWYWIKED